jgi:prolyl-tRNA editing enzyme YbaK/EbsC (Cys-tRNA(Pro) deacylase)
MDAQTTIDQPYKPLMDWLTSRQIEYELHPHDAAFTALATAAAEGVDPRTFAKVVGVASIDGRDALVVLDATDQLDLRKARRVLNAGDVRLLSEPEMKALAPDCEVGATPAVGALFGLATYADYAVRDDSKISFNAGSHHLSVRVERARWERACNVIYADLAEDADAGPARAR